MQYNIIKFGEINCIYLNINKYHIMSENMPTAHEIKGVYKINLNNHCTCENNFSWICHDLNQRPSAEGLAGKQPKKCPVVKNVEII